MATDVMWGQGPEPFAVIGPDGMLTMPRGVDPGEPIDVLARRLHRDMVLARRVDTECLALQRQGELALWLQCRGQEAAQAGSIRAVRDTDFVFPAYREHVAAIARGVTPAEFLPMWRGAALSGWDPKAHAFQIYTLVLGTQMLHGVGYAMGVRLDGADDIVVVYAGDGASSEGDHSEALNWAAVMRAPVLFFCQNNQWAISTPTEKQFASPLYLRARGFGLDAMLVDGNDALAVHLLTRHAAERVRAGGPPAFVEAVTYRIGGHSTSDDPRRYRTEAEVAAWEARDPIARLRRVLDAHHWLDAEAARALDAEAEALAAQVRATCLAMEAVPLTESFRHTLVHETAALAAERAAFEAGAAR